ncbi:fused MFS/spermidine synthase [Halorhodospira halochloris]|uniref:fused MFS/spermidine synthase n=1 Tax=Halorhodospira halochloris TaxID=1052 RepID=UPI001EE7CD44|nr:fused MFS/spermidine synthase [Halorhodospira halochloris]MCG5549422.1 fused MFS/spermidine synthase [Halorhodospira halochloris]
MARGLRWWTVILFLCSGFAALVYQVLWVRELGLLFGNTAQAAALAIAVFFAGLAAGSWVWGRLAPRLRSPLAGFGLLEIGVAITALGHFLLYDLYHAIYPALYGLAGDLAAADLALRISLATLILFPPAFLMGGTFPMIGQFMVRAPRRLATTGTALYALNTFGSVLGALAAGFFLPMALGFSGTYLLAIAIDLSVGAAALILARGQAAKRACADPLTSPSKPATSTLEAGGLSSRLVLWIAFASGFVTLAVEVLWTRLFAQVLQNSVYTYAIVLVAFLLALSLGSIASHGLARIPRFNPRHVLLALLTIAAAVVAVSPWAFHSATAGLTYVGSGAGWAEYLTAVSGIALLVMVLPGVMLGAVLPYLLRVVQAANPQPGPAIGQLVAANTSGAILGSLAAGFVLLPTLGATGSLIALGAIYPLLAVAVLAREPLPRWQRWTYATPLLVAAVALAVFRPGEWNIARVDEAAGERLIEAREGTHATVAAIKRDGNRLLRVNNYYTLGGTGGLESERNQTLIPMMAHPEPQSVFFLGLGTGITAGTALSFPVERLDACELLPEVIELAEAHFEPWTQGLFEDPRARVRAQDAHHCLRHAEHKYDVIISDLFTPWRAGTGNLYTKEHYQQARQRLEEGGLFVQWLPLYQLSADDFAIIARTMDAVFPQVVAWRGDLFADGSILALVGTEEGVTLDPEALIRHGRRLAGNAPHPEAALLASALRMYAGRITDSGLFEDAPINTLDRPVIEYQAPRTQRRVQAGEASWLIARNLGHFYEVLAERNPHHEDPYLARVRASHPPALGYVAAGRHYYHYNVLRNEGNGALAQRHLQAFFDLTPFSSPPQEAESPTTRSGWEE